MLRGNDLGVDARKALTANQIEHLSRCRPGKDIALGVAVRRAKDIIALAGQIDANGTRLEQVVSDAAPGLLDIKGVGPVTGARLLAAWGGPGWIRSEAAFARLAGTAPIPALSGNTTRHRLSRQGDRKLNSAIHTIALVRQSCDPETQTYVAKRVSEGKTTREARRCLKRHITRQLCRQLTKITP
jgi:transposase